MASLMHCVFCFDCLINYFGKASKQSNYMFSDEKYPLFISWYKLSEKTGEYDLRGCIGTFSPQDLKTGLKKYAIISALNDTRFEPIKEEEIPSLKCEVSLLCCFEVCVDVFDWQIGKHGVVIEWVEKNSQRYSATYLPQVAIEQNWDQGKTIRSLIRKTGYTGKIDDDLLKKIITKRYQTSTTEMTYQEYIFKKKENE